MSFCSFLQRKLQRKHQKTIDKQKSAAENKTQSTEVCDIFLYELFYMSIMKTI